MSADMLQVVPDETPPSAGDTYRLEFPIAFGEETVETLTLRANGKTMQGFTVSTNASGGVVFEPYRFAELGLKLAGKPRVLIDLMHPRDQAGLGMVVLVFLFGGPGTGKTPSP